MSLSKPFSVSGKGLLFLDWELLGWIGGQAVAFGKGLIAVTGSLLASLAAWLHSEVFSLQVVATYLRWTTVCLQLGSF